MKQLIKKVINQLLKKIESHKHTNQLNSNSLKPSSKADRNYLHPDDLAGNRLSKNLRSSKDNSLAELDDILSVYSAKTARSRISQ